MPSFFPGMDPCLERADRWSGVHAGLGAVMCELLARQVAPHFFVESEDNVYILGADDPACSLVLPRGGRNGVADRRVAGRTRQSI